MAVHRLTSVCIGVANVAETAAYYEEFGRSGRSCVQLVCLSLGHWLPSSGKAAR